MIIKIPNEEEAKKVKKIVTGFGEILAGSWFRDKSIAKTDELVNIMDSNNLFKVELYGGEIIWHIAYVGREGYLSTDLQRVSTVKSRYILIEVVDKVWWNRENIEEDLEDSLAQSPFGGSVGKRRVEYRFYQVMALLAHYEDNGVLDDFVHYDNVEDYKEIVFNRCIKS